MTFTVNVLSTKFYPAILSILLYTNPTSKTLQNEYDTLLRFNIAPVPTNLILDTYLDVINFTLYTRENPTHGDILKLNDVESIRNSRWDASKQTIIIIHGWIQNGLACAIIRDGVLRVLSGSGRIFDNLISIAKKNFLFLAFLEVRDCNVIILDWSEISNHVNYYDVIKTIPNVTKCLINLINFMRTEAGLQTTNLKIIGHSLGAQIAGLSAREVGKSSRVAEVVALDPALPMFEDKKPGERVDKSDAENVQIVHTCAGEYGYSLPKGTSDFYANDGRHQPGCGIDLLAFCAHLRSYKYFAESITNPKGFLGTRADGATAYMGGATLDPNAKGTYYFKTNSQYPFALGG